MNFRLLAFALFWFVHSGASGAPVMKAKVEEPVVEELMGGCSLKCAFDWTAEVLLPGASKWQPVKFVDDDTALTAWSSADPKVGAGVKIRLNFPKKLRPEEEGTVPLYGLDLINGIWKTEEEWMAYGRVKRMRLLYNRRPLREFVFADSRRWQRVSFPDVFVKSGDTMTLEILEVYPGKSRGLAITEIVLEGAH